MLTEADEARLRGIINPQYVNVKGTESHERNMLLSEIDKLRGTLQGYRSKLNELRTVVQHYRDENETLHLQVADLDVVRSELAQAALALGEYKHFYQVDQAEIARLKIALPCVSPTYFFLA